MNSLFSIKDSLYNANWLFESLAFASAGDGIVLIEEAVVALQSETALASFVAKCERLGVTVFAVQSHLDQRGLAVNIGGVRLIDEPRWAQLALEFDKYIAW